MPPLDAIRLGPAVLSGERAVAFVALAAFVVAAELVALVQRRRGRPAADPSGWAWNAVLWGLLGARLAWVVGHAGAYLAEPWSVVAVWQGGFAPWGFVLAAAAVTVLWLRGSSERSIAPLGAPVLAAVAAGAIALTALASTSTDLRVTDLDAPLERLAVDAAAPAGYVRIADFAGEPLVVNLWATWCPPCRRELPRLAAAARAEAARPDGVRILLVDQGEPAATVAAYLASTLGAAEEMPTVLLDRRGALGEASGSFGLPTTLVFDGRGELRSRIVGELSQARLDDELAGVR